MIRRCAALRLVHALLSLTVRQSSGEPDYGLIPGTSNVVGVVAHAAVEQRDILLGRPTTVVQQNLAYPPVGPRTFILTMVYLYSYYEALSLFLIVTRDFIGGIIKFNRDLVFSRSP